jgi:RNA polymerase primary sigma factor
MDPTPEEGGINEQKATTQESLSLNSSMEEWDHVLRQNLTFRERQIIILRYGIGDGYAYSLEETARIFKVTRERIRQIESKTLRKLQSTAPEAYKILMEKAAR